MSDVYGRVAERMAMAISRDDDAYAIMARKRVRAIAGSETPTIDHYREALTQCIADKAGDWRAACESASAASKEVGSLRAEIERLRLTDAEREAVETSYDAMQYAADNLGLSQADCDRMVATLRGLLERTT